MPPKCAGISAGALPRFSEESFWCLLQTHFTAGIHGPQDLFRVLPVDFQKVRAADGVATHIDPAAVAAIQHPPRGERQPLDVFALAEREVHER